MRDFLIRLVVNAFAIAVIVTLLPQGIRIEGVDEQRLPTLIGVALIFGIVNAIVKPILTLLTCSLIIFTFGLFLLVINGVTLLLTAELSKLLPGSGRLVVDGLGWAILGAILMSLIGMVTEHFLGLNDKKRDARYVQRQGPDTVYLPPDDDKDKRF